METESFRLISWTEADLSSGGLLRRNRTRADQPLPPLAIPPTLNTGKSPHARLLLFSWLYAGVLYKQEIYICTYFPQDFGIRNSDDAGQEFTLSLLFLSCVHQRCVQVSQYSQDPIHQQ